MKIAFLTDTYWPRINGVTVSTDIFANQLRTLGHEVHLWAPQYLPSASPSPEPGVSRFRSVTASFSKEDRLPDPRYRREFYRQLDAFAPEMIHVQTELASLFVRAFARRRGIPVVQTCHTYFEQYIAFYFPVFPPALSQAFARWLTRRLVKTADALVSPSQAMKAVIESYGITIPVTVIPTGIIEEDYVGIDKEEERRSSFWWERIPQLQGKRILLSVCRIAQEKNVDFLLEAVDRIRKSVPSVLLVMAGNGPYREEFQSRILQRGLEESVLCLGYVDRQELRHLYALAEVFVFASVTETQGLVTIEAMMCGTPVVAIGKMGTKEVMAGDNGGFLVDEDPEAFSAAVTTLLEDPLVYRKKAGEASSYSRLWTAARMTARLEELYFRVRDEFRGRSGRNASASGLRGSRRGRGFP